MRAKIDAFKSFLEKVTWLSSAAKCFKHFPTHLKAFNKVSLYLKWSTVALILAVIVLQLSFKIWLPRAGIWNYEAAKKSAGSWQMQWLVFDDESRWWMAPFKMKLWVNEIRNEFQHVYRSFILTFLLLHSMHHSNSGTRGSSQGLDTVAYSAIT